MNHENILTMGKIKTFYQQSGHLTWAEQKKSIESRAVNHVLEQLDVPTEHRPAVVELCQHQDRIDTIRSRLQQPRALDEIRNVYADHQAILEKIRKHMKAEDHEDIHEINKLVSNSIDRFSRDRNAEDMDLALSSLGETAQQMAECVIGAKRATALWVERLRAKTMINLLPMASQEHN